MAKAPPELPAVIENVSESPASGSDAFTLPTNVPTAEFSSTRRICPARMTGRSFTSLTEMLTEYRSDSTGMPLSTACTDERAGQLTYV